jgi:hypothetical protein
MSTHQTKGRFMTDEEITQLNLPLSSPNPNTLLPDEILHEATQELAELIVRYWKKQKQFDHDNEAIDYE